MTTLTTADANKLIVQDWIQQAESALYSAEKHRSDFSKPANGWGGPFTMLPDDVRFYDVPDIILRLKSQVGIQ